MNSGFAIAAVLAVLGILSVGIGILDESSGDRDLPVMALGVVALIAGGILQVVTAPALTRRPSGEGRGDR